MSDARQDLKNQVQILRKSAKTCGITVEGDDAKKERIAAMAEAIAVSSGPQDAKDNQRRRF